MPPTSETKAIKVDQFLRLTGQLIDSNGITILQICHPVFPDCSCTFVAEMAHAGRAITFKEILNA